MTTDPPASGIDIDAPRLVLNVAPTLTDHVEFNVYMQDRPRVRRKRTMISLAVLLIGPMLGLALGFLVGWAIDAHRSTLMAGIAALTSADWQLGLGISLLISGALGAVAGLLHLCRRPILRRRIRGLLAERPGVDRTDPELRSCIRVELGKRGFVVDGEGSHTRIAATSVREIGETRSALSLMIGRMNGFIIPMRDLSTADLAKFKAITREWPIANGE